LIHRKYYLRITENVNEKQQNFIQKVQFNKTVTKSKMYHSNFNQNVYGFSSPYQATNTTSGQYYPNMSIHSTPNFYSNVSLVHANHFGETSFSSGYNTETPSFNSSPCMPVYNNQPYYPSITGPQSEVQRPNQSKRQVSDLNFLDESKRSTKRVKYDENNSHQSLKNDSGYLTDVIIQQIFNTPLNQETCDKKRRQARNKKQSFVTQQDSPVLLPSKTVNSMNEMIKEIQQYEQMSDDGSDLDDESSNNNSVTNENKKKRVLTRQQRIAANQRERKRMNIMNESFVKLREALPINTGRKRRKMSRLDIVIGAIEYIAYLDSLLQSDEPCEINFEEYQNSLYNI
jgi:hypothetical protein